MADVARCLCPVNAAGERYGVHSACPIHGFTPADPIKPYRLSENDRTLLKSFRIATTDTDDIQRVRQADEDRFKDRG